MRSDVRWYCPRGAPEPPTDAERSMHHHYGGVCIYPAVVFSADELEAIDREVDRLNAPRPDPWDDR